MNPLKRKRARGRLGREAQRLLDLLHALGGTTFRQMLWQKAAELDLTYAQSQVLFFVADRPGCHMGDVAKTFAVTLPAVTHIVDRLEQKGFVARRSDPADRRAYRLELTPAGRDLAEELAALQIRGLEQVLARMSPQARDRVLTGLETLVDAATKVAGESARRRGRGGSHEPA